MSDFRLQATPLNMPQACTISANLSVAAEMCGLTTPRGYLAGTEPIVLALTVSPLTVPVPIADLTTLHRLSGA